MKWKQIDEPGWPKQWITTDTVGGFYVVLHPSANGRYRVSFEPEDARVGVRSEHLSVCDSLADAKREAAHHSRATSHLPSVYVGSALFNVHGPGSSYGYSHNVRANSADEAVEKLKARGVKFQGFYAIDRVVER